MSDSSSFAQDEAKKKGLPWTAAKGFDGSLPLGGVIPADLVSDPHHLTLWCSVNGVERQRASTGDMIWKVPTRHSLQTTPSPVTQIVRNSFFCYRRDRSGAGTLL